MVINDFRNRIKAQNVLELIFTIAIKEKISLETVQQRIAKSAYFNALYLEEETYPIYEATQTIISNIFYEIKLDMNSLYETIDVVSCWCAEIFTKIAQEFSFTFEAIFLYFPIEKMISCFQLYHEMDDSQILGFFEKEVKEHSVLELASEKYKISNREISLVTGLSESMVSLLKNKKKDITKLSVATSIKISDLLKIDIRSLLCNK